MNKVIDKGEEKHRAELKDLNDRIAIVNKKNFDLIHKPVSTIETQTEPNTTTQGTQTDISSDDLLIAQEAVKGISLVINQKNFMGGIDEKKRLIIVAKLWDIKEHLPNWLEDIRIGEVEDITLNIDEKKWYVERLADREKEVKIWQDAYNGLTEFYGYSQPSSLTDIKNNKKEIKNLLERVRIQFNLLRNFTKKWSELTIADIRTIAEMADNMSKSVLFTGDIKTLTERERERERQINNDDSASEYETADEGDN